MKRSEIIKIIQYTMQDNGMYDAAYGTDEINLSTKVLEAIEKAGMLPPSFPDAHNLPGVDTYHVWESEETKTDSTFIGGCR